MLGQIDEKQGKAFFLGHYQNSRIQVLMQNATISPHLGKKKRGENRVVSDQKGTLCTCSGASDQPRYKKLNSL